MAPTPGRLERTGGGEALDVHGETAHGEADRHGAPDVHLPGGTRMSLSLVGIAATVWWVALLQARLVTMAATFLHPGARRRAALRADQPGVSIVIPVTQVDLGLDAEFDSTFSQAYPGFEVLITSAETESAAIDTARRIASRFPETPVRFLLGNERRTLNPKISNIAPAITNASHDLVLIKDSNVRLPPGCLTELVRNLTPGTGMVCAIPINVGPESFPAEIECAMTNAHAAPWLMAGSLINLDIGFGKVMLFDRRDFERAGGIRVMASTFGDDHALAKALSRVGLRTVFAGGVVFRVMGRRTFREVWARQLRWMVIRRCESPLAFLAEPLGSAGCAVLAGAVAAPMFGLPSWSVAAATLAFWLAGDALVVVGRGWGWSWRFPFAGICREILIAALWVRAWSSRTVSWAGRDLEVRDEALGVT